MIGGSALALGLPLRDRANAKLIVQAALGNKVDCTSCVESDPSPYPFDAIVVPGGGLLQNDDGTWMPSERAKLRLEAASLAFRDRIAPRIVLLDGKAGSNEEQDTNYLYLGRMFAKVGVELPEGDVFRDRESVNTRTNMEMLARISAENSIRKVMIVTNGFHETRSTLFACKEKVSATSMTAEERVIEEYPEREREIRLLFVTPRAKILAAKDHVEVAMSFWDSDGKMQTLGRKAVLFYLDHKKNTVGV